MICPAHGAVVTPTAGYGYCWRGQHWVPIVMKAA